MENETTTTSSTTTTTTTFNNNNNTAASIVDGSSTLDERRTRERRRQQQEMDLHTTPLADSSTTFNHSNTSSLYAMSDAAKRQEAAMLFQDEKLLPFSGKHRERRTYDSYYYPTTTFLLILLLVMVYTHQWKSRQGRKQVLASYRELVERKAIHRAFLALVSHPPRTVRRRRRLQRSASSFGIRRQRRPYQYASLYDRLQSSLELDSDTAGYTGSNNHNNGNNRGLALLRWKGIFRSLQTRFGECFVRTWKAVSNGHLSGLPLLLYNVHILWCCRGLEIAYNNRHHSSAIIIISEMDSRGGDDDHDHDYNNSSNHHINNHPLQYLRLLVALAFLSFGMELLITHCLLKSPLLATPPSTSSSSSSSSAGPDITSAASSSTATPIVIITEDNNLTAVNGENTYHGIPGPPLSTRPEYQTRQQREIAEQRRTFWRRSLSLKPMGTMTAITAALLWIHRAHYHYVYISQQQQQAQQQQDDANKNDNNNSIDESVTFPCFPVLPLLSNPSFLSGPSSSTVSLITYTLCLLWLLLFSRYSHPGWAVVCGSIVGMLWGDHARYHHAYDHYYYPSNNAANHDSDEAPNNNVEEEGLLQFLADPYYGNWLIALLIFLSLLSLKRARKWSGWLPCIDYVAWSSSSSTAGGDSSTTLNQQEQQIQQRQQANLRRPTTPTRALRFRFNEQENFGFLDDDRNSDTDTDSDSQEESPDDDTDNDFHDSSRRSQGGGEDDALEWQNSRSMAASRAASMNENQDDNEGEIYGRIPALGDFLDDDADDDDGDLELAIRMSLQPQHNVRS